MIEEIKKIWNSVLDHSHFNEEDSFFDVGGHSLNTNTLIQKLNTKFNVTLAVRDIFENDTILLLANKIELLKSE